MYTRRRGRSTQAGQRYFWNHAVAASTAASNAEGFENVCVAPRMTVTPCGPLSIFEAATACASLSTLPSFSAATKSTAVAAGTASANQNGWYSASASVDSSLFIDTADTTSPGALPRRASLIIAAC